MSDLLTKCSTCACSADIHHESTNLIKVANVAFEASKNIGLRAEQEDRMILCPRLHRDDVAFCGVFDGTVGCHASNFVQHSILSHLLSLEEFKNFLQLPSGAEAEIVIDVLTGCFRKAFLLADYDLISLCQRHSWHYTSSTAVTALLHRNLLTVAHIGDSKACIARECQGSLQCDWLTVDHKPNFPLEHKRIVESGGSLVWLRGNKPYIRGGDFLARQARGEHPKQLNYSRAFGGKDLKTFGLIAEPDVSHFDIHCDDRLVIIASDGLWDVMNPLEACTIVLNARNEGRNATAELTRRAVEAMRRTGICDNVTVIAIFLHEK